MTLIRIGKVLAAAMADTEAKVSVIDYDFFRSGVITPPANKTGTLVVAKQVLRGAFHRVDIELAYTPAAMASINIFIPYEGQHFIKGIIVGRDFLQKAKLRINAEGEVVRQITNRKNVG